MDRDAAPSCCFPELLIKKNEAWAPLPDADYVHRYRGNSFLGASLGLAPLSRLLDPVCLPLGEHSLLQVQFFFSFLLTNSTVKFHFPETVCTLDDRALSTHFAPGPRAIIVLLGTSVVLDTEIDSDTVPANATWTPWVLFREIHDELDRARILKPEPTTQPETVHAVSRKTPSRGCETSSKRTTGTETG